MGWCEINAFRMGHERHDTAGKNSSPAVWCCNDRHYDRPGRRPAAGPAAGACTVATEAGHDDRGPEVQEGDVVAVAQHRARALRRCAARRGEQGVCRADRISRTVGLG